MPLKVQIANLLRRTGYELQSLSSIPSDFDEEARGIIGRARLYSMTRPASLFSIVEAVRYIERNCIDGAIVECGVYRGGCMLTAALTMDALGKSGRDLYLFDTFEGMTAPTPEDGAAAGKLFTIKEGPESIACRSPLEQVRQNMSLSRYPADRIHFVKGPVEDTLPAQAPERIAVLRLDTDWYQSTKHELVHLFPRLASGGVLLIDDYGHWEGVRKACDEYFGEHGIHMLLNRVDISVRSGIKP